MKIFDFSILTNGGPAVWVLAILSIAAIVVFVERALFLHRVQIPTTKFLNGIKNTLQRRRLVEAMTVCEQTPGPVAAMVKTALLNHDADELKLRLAIQETALAEIPTLERRINMLAAAARIAPLLGLLGTALGLADVFSAFMGTSTYVVPATLASGVWQALIATIVALAVAIPAHLGHYFLSSRVRALAHEMEWAGNEIIRFLLVEKLGSAADEKPSKKNA